MKNIIDMTNDELLKYKVLLGKEISRLDNLQMGKKIA